MKKRIIPRRSIRMENKLINLLENLLKSGENRIEFSIDYWLSEPVEVKTAGIHLSPRNSEKEGPQPVDGYVTLGSIDEESIIKGLEKIDWTICTMNLLLGTLEYRIKRIRAKVEGFVERDQEDFNSVSRFIQDVLNRFKDPTSYFLALDRFRWGLIATNPLEGFLHFWSSIEIISEIYFEENKSEFKKTKPQKRECVKRYFENRKPSPETVAECYKECLRTSIPEKIKFTFRKTFKNYSEKLIDIFFDIKDESERLYQIRNDIIHGRKSMYNMQDLIFIERRVRDLEHIANDLLHRSIGWQGYGDDLINFISHYKTYFQNQ